MNSQESSDSQSHYLAQSDSPLQHPRGRESMQRNGTAPWKIPLRCPDPALGWKEPGLELWTGGSESPGRWANLVCYLRDLWQQSSYVPGWSRKLSHPKGEALLVIIPHSCCNILTQVITAVQKSGAVPCQREGKKEKALLCIENNRFL